MIWTKSPWGHVPAVNLPGCIGRFSDLTWDRCVPKVAHLGHPTRWHWSTRTLWRALWPVAGWPTKRWLRIRGYDIPSWRGNWGTNLLSWWCSSSDPVMVSSHSSGMARSATLKMKGSTELCSRLSGWTFFVTLILEMLSWTLMEAVWTACCSLFSTIPNRSILKTIF